MAEHDVDDKDELVCVHERFAEYDEVLSIVNSTTSSLKTSREMELLMEHFRVLLDKYQEQPHLLDSHLEPMMGKLLSLVRQNHHELVIHQLYRYIYVILKVRGYKHVLRYFPHEVEDVEAVLVSAENQNPGDHESWSSRYVLLLWLSMVSIIPFDMSRFDGAPGIDQTSITDRIISVAKKYLSACDKANDAAAFMVARFINRSDVLKTHTFDFVSWSVNLLHDRQLPEHFRSGLLKMLALMLKLGKREELVGYGSMIMTGVEFERCLASEAVLVRKYAVQLLQRIGTTLLKKRTTEWRYICGIRSLTTNLTGNHLFPKQESSHDHTVNEEEFDIPSEVEKIIGQLLEGVGDKDTVVRYTAAKGVGRLTARLPKELAAEVLISLLEKIKSSYSDLTWHGGCLAIAELGRRGLLLPSQLPEVLPLLEAALMYEEPRGTFSVGAHVRDAACYVCWAFARAFEPTVLRPFVNSFGGHLITVAVFDREVNCRRAASAAFQENVGRQGTFPHGIEIVTLLDYCAVGRRKPCYLDLSVQIARLKEYGRVLIDHLFQNRVMHWDSEIRVLAAATLNRMVSIDPVYLASHVLPVCLELCLSSNPTVRSGNLLAVGEIFHGLYTEEHTRLEPLLSPEMLASVSELIGKVVQHNLLIGLGADLTRNSVIQLMWKLSDCYPDLEESMFEQWILLLEEWMKNSDEAVRISSSQAFHALCWSYAKSQTCHEQLIEGRLKAFYIPASKCVREFDRVGGFLALSSLSPSLYCKYLSEVVDSLISGTCIPSDNRLAGTLAESRREAVACLTRLVSDFPKAEPAPQAELEPLVQNIIEALLVCFQDHTVDSRGDVGARVREAAVVCMEVVLFSPYEHSVQNMIQSVAVAISELIAEKNPKVRLAARRLLQRVVLSDRSHFLGIPHREEVASLLSSSQADQSELWTEDSESFSVIMRFLDFDIYRKQVLSGLVTSVGGLTLSLTKRSSSALLHYIQSGRGSKDVTQVLEMMADMLQGFKNDDRVVFPLLKTWEILLDSDALLETSNADALACRILDAVKSKTAKCSDVKRFLVAVSIYSALLQFSSSIFNKALFQLMLFLGHTLPRVRQATAEKLYNSIVIYNISAENQGQLLDLLGSTCWVADLDAARTSRNTLCDLLGVPRPVSVNRRVMAGKDGVAV